MDANENDSTLDSMLCFAVYSLERQIGRIYRDLLAPWNLSYTQYIVLVALRDASGRSLTVGALGRKLDLDSGTLSPLLKRLEGRGFIARTRDTTDERALNVALTPSGVDLGSELADIQRCLIERMPMDPSAARDLRDRARSMSAQLTAQH